MGAVERIEVGDYDLRGPDFDTILIGPVFASIIDADRLVRMDFRNGFPNWDLYRAALAGDSVHLSRLRQWCVAFSIAYCQTGGVRRDAYSDELACVAAWDALNMLLRCRQIQPYTATADAIGVHHKTYRKLRDSLYRRLKASLDEYWIHLTCAFRQVVLYENKQKL